MLFPYPAMRRALATLKISEREFKELSDKRFRDLFMKKVAPFSSDDKAGARDRAKESRRCPLYGVNYHWVDVPSGRKWTGAPPEMQLFRNLFHNVDASNIMLFPGFFIKCEWW